MTERVEFEQRVLAALDGSPSRIPVVLGGCGTGRTSLLHALGARVGDATQYLDIERCATTPERFLQAVTHSSPFTWAGPDAPPATARAAFETLLAFFNEARTPTGGTCTFLLDEVLELRAFASFPGLRHVLRDLLEALAASPNRFVLTTRYVSRAHHLLRDAAPRFEVLHMTPLAPTDVAATLAPVFNNYERMATDDRDYLARTVQALTDGRDVYVRALARAMQRLDLRGRDPISALTSLMTAGGELAHWCGYCYELRLQRARGYGALKAILEILAEEEPLTLTEISQRLHRTPGSTKDYLSWLEDVDLIGAHHKRYSFTDPVLRLWVRLHCRPTPPADDEVAAEVQRYAAARVPERTALAYAGVEATAEERKSWGIIEID
jgi:hypothetical protein